MLTVKDKHDYYCTVDKKPGHIIWLDGNELSYSDAVKLALHILKLTGHKLTVKDLQELTEEYGGYDDELGDPEC